MFHSISHSMSHPVCRAVLAVVLSCGMIRGAAAEAAEAPPQPGPREIVAQQTALRAQVLAGKGSYQRMDRRSREALATKQQEVIDMLEGVATIDALSVERRTEVFNALEWIRATIARSENDRKICEYAQTVGSHRRASVCTTAREEREHRDNAREQVRRTQGCNVSRLACVGD